MMSMPKDVDFDPKRLIPSMLKGSKEIKKYFDEKQQKNCQ